MIISRCIPIFLVMYIYFYIYDLANKQTKMFIMIQHTKKSEQPTKGRMPRFYYVYLFILTSSTSSEDDIYIFILIERLNKVYRNVLRGHTTWFIEEPAAGPLDLRHGPRICQKFMNVEHVYIRQCRRHGTTIHTYCFIQAEAELDHMYRDTLHQVALSHISSNGRVQ